MKEENNLPVTIVGIGIFIALIIFALNYSTKSSNTIAVNDSPQSKCKVSAKIAFEKWGGGLSEKFINAIKDDGSMEVSNIGSTNDYKYNYDNNVNLCFMEYIFSWNLKEVSSGNEGQVNVKTVHTLFSATTDPTTKENSELAAFVSGTAPSGSKVVEICTVMTSGHYDDLTKKSYNDRINPTQCASESEFDLLVFERMGIK